MRSTTWRGRSPSPCRGSGRLGCWLPPLPRLPTGDRVALADLLRPTLPVLLLFEHGLEHVLLDAANVELLDGKPRLVRVLIEETTVLLFWDPACGFCRSLHDDLRAWEQRRPDGAPRLLVVSAGAVDDVRAESFSSTVVLDPDWTVSGSLGADGTPMAVLVDAKGRIASSRVTGADDVLGLLGARTLSATR